MSSDVRPNVGPTVRSAFDIAFWFLDKALDDNEYLQPQKLQRLLFLAQGYYGALGKGRKLMPAFFVADDAGPLEPNVFAAFSRGRPDVDTSLFLPDEAEAIVKGVWRRFGHHSTDHLTRLAKRSAAYREAYERGMGTEIAHEALCRSFMQADTAPSPQRVAGPRVMVTQTGRPVTVQRWSPAAAATSAASR